MIQLDLLPNLPIILDARSRDLGGSFWYDPLRVYDPVPLQWAYDRLQTHSNPVLLDVGASTGCFSLLAAHLPALQVWAFEPVPETARVLTENVRLNQVKARVHVYQSAMSDHTGVEVMHIVEPLHCAGLSMLGGNPTGDRATYHDVKVTVSTIDDLCANGHVRPTLIKVDTEGHELHVLRGATETIRRDHPDIVVEYSDINAAQHGYAPTAIEDYLRNEGYEWVNLNGADLCAIWRG